MYRGTWRYSIFEYMHVLVRMFVYIVHTPKTNKYLKAKSGALIECNWLIIFTVQDEKAESDSMVRTHFGFEISLSLGDKMAIRYEGQTECLLGRNSVRESLNTTALTHHTLAIA